MASSPSPVFNGSSTYSSSFQQVLTRAVSIASLPLQQIQNKVSTLAGQQSALSGIESSFANLQSTITSIGTTLQSSRTATVSDSSVVSASATPDALNGTYTIAVDNLGSYTTTLSKAGLTTVTDPTADDIDASDTFTLQVNGNPFTVSPSGSSLVSLANAINDSGAGVQATIVNIGSTASPDYRLAIASNNLGGDTIQLTDSTGNDLLDTLATGTAAAYRVNGIATDIQSTSRTVTLSPGLTVNLLQQSASGTSVTITVSNSYGQLQNAISNFASAYNSAVDALTQQRGQNGGALSGQSIVYSLTNALRSVSQFTSANGSVGSLADLGLTLDENGHLNFDASAFNSLNPTDVQQFLGSTASGGFLQAANQSITAVSDPTSGLIQGDIASLTDQIQSQSDQMTQEQNRINDLQDNLMQQLSAADAAIATLEAQKSYFTDLFQAEFYNNNNNNGSGG